MIQGLSERRRLPRAGKIRLGEKRLSEKTGNPYPAAVDYFVWPEEYAEKLTALFGEKARELEIMFPVEDPEQICPQYLKRYGTSGLLCRGDGVTAEMVNEGGEWVEIDCNPETCPHYSPSDPAKKSCRQVMNLRFVIPALISEGVWQIDTSSYNSIVNINSGLDYIRALVGRVAMVPLRLRIIPKEVQPDGKKKIVHVLDLKLGSQIGLKELQALAGSAERPILALPVLDDVAPPDDLFPIEAAAYEHGGAHAPTQVAEELDGDLEPPAQDPDCEDGEPDEIDSAIADLQAALGHNQAKMALRWKKVGGDKQAMLELLKAEYDSITSKGRLPKKTDRPTNSDSELIPQSAEMDNALSATGAAPSESSSLF